ncbi:ead/Ea22-like family protein [Salmonella enterica]|nr:ead/Ea22-like family protein [Salmonella enterica]EBW5500640.1 ead/Ea22-like family protein [Salmonella enterica subsp. enterica serovar Enteritidis]EDS7649364.1 ead/Ea22-like family protein [Salmonella enterica subsp. enterica serovar Thompson]EDU1383562.1 ead/Ea22-like family protein [Salmonella enterica subsp. enterica serovar 4,[5],12:b:-]EEC0779621.1 ead/Ea22-like family protein [Salmonella enterica subsp. enterica serovar Hvittingfoss]
MSNIDKQALREVAEKAGKDKWQARKINGDFFVIRHGSYEKQSGITSFQSVAEIDDKAVRDFVAMANPAAVLALLDENIQLQWEKDATEAVLSAMRDDMRQAREQLKAAEKQVEELTMWIKRLAHSLRNAKPNSKLYGAAMDYLSHKGLISVEDVLR